MLPKTVSNTRGQLAGAAARCSLPEPWHQQAAVCSVWGWPWAAHSHSQKLVSTHKDQGAGEGEQHTEDNRCTCALKDGPPFSPQASNKTLGFFWIL